jgi:hypothetical protein
MLKIYFAELQTEVAILCEVLQNSVVLKTKSHPIIILTYLLTISACRK